MGMVIGSLVCDGVQESLYIIALTSDCEVSEVFSDRMVRLIEVKSFVGIFKPIFSGSNDKYMYI